MVNINDSITNVNVIMTGDGNVAEFTDGGAITTISADTLDDVEEGRTALVEASALTEESTASVAE